MIPQRKSSDEMQRDRGCGKKHRYGTRSTAETALKNLKAKKGKQAKHVNVYHCRFCDCYHLGKNKPR